MRCVILDCYTDEPAGLGVPPYLGTYPRYVAGAILDGNQEAKVTYVTIDQVRDNTKRQLEYMNKEADLVVFIGGSHTPGRYLRTRPATPREISKIASRIETPKILGGPIVAGHSQVGGVENSITEDLFDVFEVVSFGDVERAVYDYVNGKESKRNYSRRTYEEVDRWAVLGSFVVKEHPCYPFIVCEIETSRGCPRALSGGCSFCIEPRRYGLPEFRSEIGIAKEIASLYQRGCKYFRLGRQSDIIIYGSEDARKKEVPTPNPEMIERLFLRIWREAPGIEVLHVDNANPAVIARRPESRKVIEALVRYCTPGNVLAFGLETSDPEVAERNNLLTTGEDILKALRIVNEIGQRKGWNGMPMLLPGINFVLGLKGETPERYFRDLEFLKKIIKEGYLVRRINVREVAVLKGTAMQEVGNLFVKKHSNLINYFKKKVREEIDPVLLRRITPKGTILREVFTEVVRNNWTFGRQFGSYPLTVKVPGRLEVGKFIDVLVMGNGSRSVIGIPYPIRLSEADPRQIEMLPGMNRRKAVKLLSKRPRNEEELMRLVDRKLLPFLELS